MRKNFLEIILVVVVLWPLSLIAQLNEDFSDGDFTSNPVWLGDVSDFTVNLSNELQLNAPSVSSVSYLSTETGLLDFSNNIIWEFKINLLFNPSNSNTGRFYLVSNYEDLNGALNGYYLRIGESGAVDKLKLYRQDGLTSSSDELICTGMYGAYGSSPNARIRVTRDVAGNWLIEADSLGGTNFIFEAGGTDTTHQFSKYSGVWCKYTSSNSTKFIFDDIIVSANVIIDNDPPTVVSAVVTAENSIDLSYNESVTTSAEDINNYFLSGGNGQPLIVVNINNSYQLIFNDSFLAGDQLSLDISNVFDLSNNSLTTTIPITVPDTAFSGEIIINEILFDPFTGGSDYLELYNVSNKSIDLYGYMIADYDNAIDNFKTITTHYILNPESYVLLTEDSIATANDFFQNNSQVFLEMDLPTFPNDSATAYVLNPDSVVLDYLSYSDDMHFDLINNVEGVSLERIGFSFPSNNPSSWHSAAESAGWGTPGLENSHNFSSVVSDLLFNVDTPVFSPDSDGFEDLAIFSYQMNSPGNVANLVVYDKLGRVINTLLSNELLSSDGVITWDGVMSSGDKAPIGIYLIYFEVFDLNGNVQVVKKTVTLKSKI
ncbi:MAG: hypothetical protein CL853_00205 [Crocinitomicaceae bacterium]|nr:hypothetical protein [Crocinitomicaceae bacterium]